MVELINRRKRRRLEHLLRVDDPVFDSDHIPDVDEEQVLLFSKTDGLYAWKKNTQEPIKVVNTDGFHFKQMCWSTEKGNRLLNLLDDMSRLYFLYVGDDDIIIKETKSAISISAICSFKDDYVYTAQMGNKTGIVQGSDVIATVPHKVNCLCEYKGKLIAGCENGIIYDCADESETQLGIQSELPVSALCASGKNLFAAVGNLVQNVNSKRYVRARGGVVVSLAVFDNAVVDCGHYGVYLNRNAQLKDVKNTWAVCSAPISLYNKKLEEK